MPKEVWCLSNLLWYNVYTKFRENWWTGFKFDMGDINACSKVMCGLLFFSSPLSCAVITVSIIGAVSSCVKLN
jgi:hypothetical protein